MTSHGDNKRDSGSLPLSSMADAEPVVDRSPPGQLPFPTIAVGASAGGVDALKRLFAAMPGDTGCAFLVMMHLAPDRESMLAPLLARVTSMPVEPIENGGEILPGHVYVAPP